MTDMTNEEWLAHSEDWRRGYNAWAHEETIVNYDAMTQEWKDGFKYAMHTVGAGGQ